MNIAHCVLRLVLHNPFMLLWVVFVFCECFSTPLHTHPAQFRTKTIYLYVLQRTVLCGYVLIVFIQPLKNVHRTTRFVYNSLPNSVKSVTLASLLARTNITHSTHHTAQTELTSKDVLIVKS